MPENYNADDGLPYFREKILTALLSFGVALSLFALIPGLILGFREKLWAFAIIIIIIAIWAIVILLNKKLSYTFRANSVLLMIYLLGVNSITNAGIFSGGPLWLFFFAIIAALLLGRKIAGFAIVINFITLTILGWLIDSGKLGDQLQFFTSTERIIAAFASFLFLNTVASISIASMLRGLQNATGRQKAAAEQLLHEKKQLLSIEKLLKEKINERQLSESALIESEARYRLLAENINDLIWKMDMDMKFTYVNPVIYKMLGWQPQEFLNLKIQDLLTPGSYEIVRNILEDRLTRGEKTRIYDLSVTFEIELVHKNKSTVWVEAKASFLLTNNGLPASILGVARDITERKKSQVEKEDLREKLSMSKKMEALGLLAGGVAHDLNNVLSGVVSYPDLILLDLPENSKLYKQITTIRDSGQKAAAIVQDLLTMTRRGVITSTVFNLNEIMNDYFKSPEHNHLMTFHSRIKIEKKMEDNLPNISGSVVHLKKTLMNLITNAAEAQSGSGEIRIKTGTRHLTEPVKGYDYVNPGEYVVLTIEDDGDGISNEDMQHIFEPFYTKKTMGRSGTGLGMSVVWGTVQDFKGYINVISTEGKGTVFELYFPITEKKIPLLKNKKELLEYLGNNETILVVDDTASQRKITNKILKKLNYNVALVTNGEEAIAYLKKNNADLVILDMIMEGGMDGLDTFREIISLNPEQKAIIVSGYAETDQVKTALELGAGRYIKKPYTIEKIGLAVKEELG